MAEIACTERGDGMDERTLKVLEYNKIIERLADFCVSDSGRKWLSD